MGDIFKNRLSEAKSNLEQKIKKMAVWGLGLKWKHKPKKAQSQGKLTKVKDNFTQQKKK